MARAPRSSLSSGGARQPGPWCGARGHRRRAFSVVSVPLPASRSPEALPGGVCMGTALLSGGTPCRSPVAGAEPPRARVGGPRVQARRGRGGPGVCTRAPGASRCPSPVSRPWLHFPPLGACDAELPPTGRLFCSWAWLLSQEQKCRHSNCTVMVPSCVLQAPV